MKHVHGGNIYTYRNCMDFSANCNPLGTPESVKQAVRDSLDRTGDYPQVGYAPLREALGEYEDMDPRHIICCRAYFFTLSGCTPQKGPDSCAHIC